MSKLGDTDTLTNDDKVDNELVDVVAVVVVWLTKEDEDTGVAAADVWPSKEDVAASTAEDEVSKLGDTDTLTNDDKVDNKLVDVVAVVVVWLTKEDEDTGVAAADVWPSKEDVAASTAEDEVSKFGDTDTLTNDDKVDNELVDVVAVVVVWLTKEDEDTGVSIANVWLSKEDVAAWTAEDEVSKLGDTDALTDDGEVV